MPAHVEELAYVVIDTADIDGWVAFADVLGLAAVRDASGARLRMDARPFRYLVRRGVAEALPTLGWRVANAVALSNVSARVADLGLSPAPLTNAALEERGVHGGFRFRCHNGIDHEVVHGIEDGDPFTPMSDVTGFVTSPGGLGHAVWTVPDVDAMDRLILDAFGMALREDIRTPTGVGHFYGCDPRHHSLAVISGPELQIVHLMAEMQEVDDVGRAMNRFAEAGYELLEPLGRHRTDHMLSFYAKTPAGFGMEVGCDGVLCGDDWAEVREANRRRPWGHGAAMRQHQKTFPTVAK